MRKLCALILALVLLASAAGCAATENGSGEAEQEQQGGASASTLPDTDRSGNPIALPEEVNAVISMAPPHPRARTRASAFCQVSSYSNSFSDSQVMPPPTPR